jgi:Coenzyme F420-dependent N5,N10-methylene tetrahydromethanopterin reductase and related flavin-dependent oxidoreductases
MVTAFGDDDLADVAVHAENSGYDAVWVGELWGASGVVQATEMACRTDEIRIGTAILNVYSRSPAVLAMTAASLEEASDGRFTLGLGTSTATAIEGLHGTAFDRPVRRAHETIELIREFTAGTGEPVDYEGELLEAADFPSIEASVPIYHAGLGSANRRVVGRLADGWIPHNIPLFRPSTRPSRRSRTPPGNATASPTRSRSRRTSRRRSATIRARLGTPSADTSPTTSGAARATAGRSRRSSPRRQTESPTPGAAATNGPPRTR